MREEYYVKLVKKFKPFEACNSQISETAEIGEGTIIQPNVFIGNHVKIGKNCLIHSNVSIYDNTIIGDNVIIHANSVLGADAYYFQRRPEGYRKLESCGRVIIRDNVEIGALCSIDKGVSGDTTIDCGTKLDNHCQVGHDTYIGKNCLIWSYTRTLLGRFLANCSSIFPGNDCTFSQYFIIYSTQMNKREYLGMTCKSSFVSAN